MAHATKTAAEYAADLMQNAADFCADRISYETMGERNRATWQSVVAEGDAMHDAVLAALRDVQRAAQGETR